MGKIDFTRFSETTSAIVPIVGMVGKYNGRKFIYSGEDGWYKVFLGDIVTVERKATLLEVEKELGKYKTLTGYAYGDEAIPVCFENLSSRGYGETVHVYFNKGEPWEAIRFAQVESGKFVYVDVAFAYHTRLNHLRQLFERGQALTHEKGTTVEEKYYFLLLSLERNTWRHLQELESLKLTKKEREKRTEEFKLNWSERMQKAVENAGGKFIAATRKANNRFLVTWRAGRQVVKSVVQESLRVEHAGYCLSGFDKQHSLQSLINLAKIYREESGSLTITRA